MTKTFILSDNQQFLIYQALQGERRAYIEQSKSDSLDVRKRSWKMVDQLEALIEEFKA